MMEKKYIIFMESILVILSNKIQGQDRKEKWSDLWYIFKPKGFDKTLAEMNEQERDDRRSIDGSYSAMEKFAEWYQENN